MSSYKLMVDDNFHYMNEDDRYQAGVFATGEEALAAACKIVDDWLVNNYKPGMTADTLYSQYTSFGEDPFILAPPGAASVTFSAWDYARARAQAICSGEIKAER